MSTLLDRSEQIAVVFEIVSSQKDWVFSRIAFQHYVASDNNFATWVEGFLDVHESDMQAFTRELAAVAAGGLSQQVLCFEPAVEPAFEIRFQLRVSPGREAILVSVALDVKCIIDSAAPTVYRDNRVSLQLLTDLGKFRTFAEQFSLEAAKVGSPNAHI